MEVLGLYVVLERTPLALRSWRASGESVHGGGGDGGSYISNRIWLAKWDHSPPRGTQAHPARPEIFASISQNRWNGHTMSNQLEPYLSVLGSFHDEESLGNAHGAGRENTRVPA